MISEPPRHPDLLRRFVATPYVFTKSDGPNGICIESNDLEIALGVRHSDVPQPHGDQAGVRFCKLIRDVTGPVGGSEMSIVSCGRLRVLRRGIGTILIHDLETSELLGFISPDVKTQELISSLIPALLNQ
jgi:hypothetical protein